MNNAAIELCLADVSLLDRRGELLQQARKKVAEDGYVFKKGRSRSKVYGVHESESTPKRPKCDQEMREERLEAIDEEMKDIARMLQFKEKRLSQAEAARNYTVCERVTEEIMALKSRKRELDAEKRLFENKVKRAKGREARIQRALNRKRESEASDIDSGPLSKTTSTCSSQSESESSSASRSVTPKISALPSPTSPIVSDLQTKSSQLGSQNKPIECGSTSDSNDPLSSVPEQPHLLESQTNGESKSADQPMPVQPCPLSPSQPGSRIKPIECESNSFSSPSPLSEAESSTIRNTLF